MPNEPHVTITVTCDSGHIIGTWTDTIEEKYPFWCEQCDSIGNDADKRTGSYPWKITTEVVSDPTQIAVTMIMDQAFEQGRRYERNVAEGRAIEARGAATTMPAAAPAGGD